MAEFTPHFAPLVVLLFLATGLELSACILLLFYGAARRSSFIAMLAGGSAFTIAIGYLLLLAGVSFASSEKILPTGSWKYFCEIDCHIAYSLIGAETASALGPEMQQISAHGKFIIVRVKTWFDKSTISAQRGNGPLTPNRRKIVLLDDTGRSFPPAVGSQAVLLRFGSISAPLTQALRPGESYTSDFLFDVPKDARGLRLFITEDDPESRLVIGHENSLLHKKIYFAVDSAPPLSKNLQ
jgi:hypothetical protein